MAATNAPEYDAIAEPYKASKQLEFRQFVEHHTLRQVLARKHPDLVAASSPPAPGPPVAGRAILDLACGEGIYSRAMKRVGASEVLGVDISPEMVSLAKKAEAAEPLGCKFLVGDASQLELGVEEEGRYDIVLALWLLNYAKTGEELDAMVAGAFRYLKPGGRLVGINDWPGNPLASYSLYQPYGFIKVSDEDAAAPRKAGTRFEYTFTLPDESIFKIHNWYHPEEAYQAAFARAGFEDFMWLAPLVSKEGLSEKPKGFWDTLIADPPWKAICATKPTA